MKKLSPVAIFATLILFACGGKPSTEESTPIIYSGNTAIGVTHSVKDFAAFQKVYMAKSDSNARISMYVSPEDPNLVTVFLKTVSHEDAKKMSKSEELKKDMTEAGVSSEPTFLYLDMKYRNMEKSTKKYRVLVSHEVADYEAWKKVFDSDAPRRNEAGLELRALSTDADNAKMVYIMFATEDANQAKGMMDTDELKAKMKEAGVTSEPKVTVLMLPPTM